MKLAEVVSSKIPSCKAPSNEIQHGKMSDISEEVPPYYHAVAIDLYDKFQDGNTTSVVDGCIEEIDDFFMKYALDHLGNLESLQSQNDTNEYLCSSQLQVILNRFLFHQKDRIKKGALFAQYPVYGTRRTDGSVYAYCDSLPWRGLLHYDYKPTDLEKASHESVCYFISSLMGLKKYGWAFGLPCTSTDMVFNMYMSGNSKAYTIELSRVKLYDSSALEILTIVYAAVHHYIDNSEELSLVPFGCQPIHHKLN